MLSVPDIEKLAAWVLLTPKRPFKLAQVTPDPDDDRYAIVEFWHESKRMLSVRCSREKSVPETEATLIHEMDSFN